MRLLSILLTFLIGTLGIVPGAFAQPIDCANPLSPVSEILCADDELRDLNQTVKDIFSAVNKGLEGHAQQELWREHRVWLDQRKSTCRLENQHSLLQLPEILRARHCMRRIYLNRINDLDTHWSGRHRSVISDENAYFTFIRSVTSSDEARLIQDRLKLDYPGKQFAIYPPYRDSRFWRIVSASYTDRASAELSRDIARRVGYARDAWVWRLPTPFSQTVEWRPIEEALPLESSDPSVLALATKIQSCFNGHEGVITVQMMRECSGVWVTPRTLALCALKTQCPALPDSLENRAIVRAALHQLGMSFGDQLTLRKEDIPALPATQAIADCKALMTDLTQFEACVLLPMASQKYPLLEACTTSRDVTVTALCIAESTENEALQRMVECVVDAGARTEELVEGCININDIDLRLQAARSCIGKASTAEAAASCLIRQLPNEQVSSIYCVAEAADRDAQLDCLAEDLPQVRTVQEIVRCVGNGETGTTALAACAAGLMGGTEYTRALRCLGGASSRSTIECIATADPELQSAYYAYNCLSNYSELSYLLTECSTLIPGLNDQTVASVACVANAGDSREALLGCASSAVLPPEAARYVGCAARSTGLTDFAICAAAPLVNEEWRIAAECAANSGGQPYVFAGCAVTRLTVREITKCFTGEFGKDCFGPNNTIVQYYTNAFNDITKGPGKNNEVVKVIGAVSEAIDKAIDEDSIRRRTRVTIDDRSGCNLARNLTIGIVKC